MLLSHFFLSSTDKILELKPNSLHHITLLPKTVGEIVNAVKKSIRVKKWFSYGEYGAFEESIAGKSIVLTARGFNICMNVDWVLMIFLIVVSGKILSMTRKGQTDAKGFKNLVLFWIIMVVIITVFDLILTILLAVDKKTCKTLIDDESWELFMYFLPPIRDESGNIQEVNAEYYKEMAYMGYFDTYFKPYRSSSAWDDKYLFCKWAYNDFILGAIKGGILVVIKIYLACLAWTVYKAQGAEGAKP